jgi:hypothetical protein
MWMLTLISGLHLRTKETLPERLREYCTVIRLGPNDAGAHTYLGNGLGRK